MHIYDVRAEFQGAYSAARSSTRYIAIHHAAALYATRNGIDDVRAVARYHTQTQGWPGIGYHWCLAEETQGGPIALYQCSALGLQRAHTAHRNHEAVGVSCLTNFDTHPGKLPEQKWLDALAEAVRLLKQTYSGATIVGHTDIALGPSASPDGKDWRTSCPGSRWQEWKPRLLAEVAGQPAQPAQPDLWASWGDDYPIREDQKGWATSQAWLRQREQLGAATSPYTYPDRKALIITFAGGLIVQAPGKLPIVELYR